MSTLNHDKIVTDKGFDEWIKSICAELNRIFAIKVKVPPWCENAEGGCQPATAITNGSTIYFDIAPELFNFSFTHAEYEKYRKRGVKDLKNLLIARLADCIWSIEDYRQSLTGMIMQFDRA